MKLQIKKETIEEIDIEFPYFTRNSISLFAFTSEKECVQVSNNYNSTSYEIEVHNSFPKSWMLLERSTAAEFMAAKKEVESLIKGINFYTETEE